MKKIFLSLITGLVLLFAGCKSGFNHDEAVSVKVSNKTDQSISVESISYFEDNIFPVVIETNSSETISSCLDFRPEGFDFVMKSNEETFEGSTGYVQDYSKFELELTTDSENQLICTLKKENRKLDLTKK